MTAIALQGVSKTFAHYGHALDRLREVLTGRRHHQERVALQPLDLTIGAGEVVGLIGLNGAGKSTLLKLVAGTLTPTTGAVQVNGRVSALLELGTGFHPDMSGRDNVYLSGAVKGISGAQVDELYEGIVAFAGLPADVMEQPVKTFSSGMYVRLAFAVATCVEPQILIIDEALSVGDAEFARKSFDRIMSYKHAGKTILFCTHSLYQVEAICNRALWLHQGRLNLDGEPARVVTAYNNYLDSCRPDGPPLPAEITVASRQGTARLRQMEVAADGVTGGSLRVVSGQTDVTITVAFASDPALPAPSVAVCFTGGDGRILSSASTYIDGLQVARDAQGEGQVTACFPSFSLLKGQYGVDVYLMCEQGVHVYEPALRIAELNVTQRGLEQGVVNLPRNWSGCRPSG